MQAPRTSHLSSVDLAYSFRRACFFSLALEKFPGHILIGYCDIYPFLWLGGQNDLIGQDWDISRLLEEENRINSFLITQNDVRRSSNSLKENLLLLKYGMLGLQKKQVYLPYFSNDVCKFRKAVIPLVQNHLKDRGCIFLHFIETIIYQSAQYTLLIIN